MNKIPIRRLPRFNLNPIDRDIIRALASTRLKVTPSRIARTINVHPVTVKNRIKPLTQRDIIQCQPKGNRTYCSVDLSKLKKKLKNDFFWR